MKAGISRYLPDDSKLHIDASQGLQPRPAAVGRRPSFFCHFWDSGSTVRANGSLRAKKKKKNILSLTAGTGVEEAERAVATARSRRVAGAWGVTGARTMPIVVRVGAKAGEFTSSTPAPGGMGDRMQRNRQKGGVSVLKRMPYSHMHIKARVPTMPERSDMVDRQAALPGFGWAYQVIK